MIPPRSSSLSDFMHGELTPDELRQWLSQDPETVTVEDIQALPRSSDVADHCRGTG